MATTTLWNDTIVALATAPGVGALGLVRLSGADALRIVGTLFGQQRLEQAASHSVLVGWLRRHGVVIDEVVVSVFRNPRSFTGEDVVEISCHGSAYIVAQIVEACVQAGARLALPGEYTQRAFLNGKLDLAQAEAVADLIACDSMAAHQLALQQLRGGVSGELKLLRQQLIEFAALIELELDFAEEDVAFADRGSLLLLLQNLVVALKALIASFAYGNAIKHGVPVAIAGKPNAGKSSLLNALLNEDRAIVSSIAGTTRDVIEDTLTIDGVLFRLIDTAGLRHTTDAIEAIGVEKAKAKIAQAQVLLYLYDVGDATPAEVVADVQQFGRADLLVMLVQNKTDVTDAAAGVAFAQALQQALRVDGPQATYLGISTREPASIAQLKAALHQMVSGLQGQASAVISNQRHKTALQQTLLEIEQVQSGFAAGLSGDLLSHHIRQALYHLGSITGDVQHDRDILGTIFGKFCIGK
ncbi:MAG: tRNA uridine-5-carboxymethylaminomethyl(34) synthesis GTPase MnmE [Bacteroidetes bacterium]|nr:MAG: tRNA uridine-5-carboxymethylaminomethyl(34) synthesis GTPase MnmE [Bacteroidota bacterium]